MSLRADLRRTTADDHARLDATFGRFDLSDPADYRRFLTAHARALVPVETAIRAAGEPEGWQPRAALLADDLAALGAPPPSLMNVVDPSEARLWGMRYVVEGSRLGGAMLAAQVGEGLPATYLGARHGKGEWRGFLDALEAAGDAGGEHWRAEAIEGARAAFALFAESARIEGAGSEPRDG